MDVSVGTVTLMLVMMTGVVVLALLFLAGREVWRRWSKRSNRALDGSSDGAWVAQERTAVSPDPESERLAQWHALWAATSDPASWRTDRSDTPHRPTRPRTRRVLVGALAIAAVPIGYWSWMHVKPAVRELPPEESIALVAVDKWADAVSMFEDKLRLRFQYRNDGQRTVDAFSVFVRVKDDSGRVVIQDHISINNAVAPGESSTWTETYWATCDQNFSPSAWNALLRKDVSSYDILWHPVGLVFADGQTAAATLPTIRGDVTSDTLARGDSPDGGGGHAR